MKGLEACLDLGADIIVNTDADNQYNSNDIEKLVAPLLANDADIVIGVRSIQTISHFSPVKKLLQRLGSSLLNKILGTQIEDVTSGFRALTKEAAGEISIYSSYTYTLEMIIQAAILGLRIVTIAIGVNENLRPSRLMRNTLSYIVKSIATITRIYILYYPLKLFSSIAKASVMAGLLVALRFLVLYLVGAGQGHIQSLILCAILLLNGSIFYVLAIILDSISVNRMLLMRIRREIRKKPQGTL
jgi:glycosyltransferase involved in cell wall biosynthesis